MLPFFFRYLKYNRVKNKTAFDAELPWINIGALDYLTKILKPEMRVFEYGSGGSTLFLSKRVSEIISVEHDQPWFAAMNEKVKDLMNVSLIYKEPVKRNDNDYGSFYGNGWQGYSFEEYVKVIDQYPDQYFDLVIIDGRSRSACFLHAIKKIKKGGYLLFDNSERDKYQGVLKSIEDKLSYRMYGPAVNYLSFTQTSIYHFI